MLTFVALQFIDPGFSTDFEQQFRFIEPALRLCRETMYSSKLVLLMKKNPRLIYSISAVIAVVMIVFRERISGWVNRDFMLILSTVCIIAVAAFVLYAKAKAAKKDSC
jgi:hypothetical protein